MHDYLTQPQVSESDLIVHALNFLSCSVKDVLASVYTNELTAISNLRDLFSGWNPQHPPTLPLPAPPPLRQPPRVVTPTTTLPPPPAPNLDPPRPPLTSLHTPGQKLPNLAELNSHDLPPPLRRSPRVHTSPNMPIKVDEPAPVAHRTRTRLKMSPLATASRTSPSKFIKIWAASAVLHGNQWSPLVLFVLDPETGQSLEHRALRRHPRLGPDWNTSYSNELGRLCQGIGVNPADPSKQRVEGTNTFHPIRYENIPLDRRKEIAFSKVVCTFHPDKADPNRTRITIAGQNIKYPGDVGTKTASLDLLKLLLNSVLSHQ